MPLRDHFHAPVLDEAPWEGVHGQWLQTIVRELNTVQLPERYRAFGQVHRGTQVEIDVATFDEGRPAARPAGNGNGVATAVWAPPAPTRTSAAEFPAQDLFEVLVEDTRRRRRLVAAVELVSPSNKDRPENRRAFAVKCASYLQQRVSVVIVDVVTECHFNLHREMYDLFGLADVWTDEVNLYAAADRATKNNEHWQVDLWAHALAVGAPLPTLPLWLAADLAVPLLLEETYEETCRVLRIP
jgi:hypothetical protein